MGTEFANRELNDLWERLDREATEAKFSQQALMQLSERYQHWDRETQRVARAEFCRWLHSDNTKKRFDALAMIDEFSITEAERDLQQLEARLEIYKGPEASFERQRVSEVLSKLAKKA